MKTQPFVSRHSRKLAALLAPTALAVLTLAGGAVSAKTLVYCSEGSPENFYPGVNTTGTSFDVTTQVYNTIVEFERGGTKVVPGLAEKWDISADGTQYTFHLRKGVKWHDGTPLTAEDVKATFEAFVIPRKLPAPNGTVDAKPAYDNAMHVARPALQKLYRDTFAQHRLDALVFPTVPRVAPLAAPEASSPENFGVLIQNTDPGSNAGIPGVHLTGSFARLDHPDFATLEKYCEPGDSFYFDIWAGATPPGWRLDKEARMFKMIWDAAAPESDPATDAIPLKGEHASQAMDLARLTNPGPFGIRTPELGEYFGYFDGGRLIAMAGERMCAGDLHEVSGICTHPDHLGRGLARKLTLKLVSRQMRRGKRSFLHVLSHNVAARALYEKLGFRTEGRLRRAVRRGQTFHDAILMSILKDEWQTGATSS